MKIPRQFGQLISLPFLSMLSLLVSTSLSPQYGWCYRNHVTLRTIIELDRMNFIVSFIYRYYWVHYRKTISVSIKPVTLFPPQKIQKNLIDQTIWTIYRFLQELMVIQKSFFTQYFNDYNPVPKFVWSSEGFLTHQVLQF